ncbi:MAG: RluA family pseudouridine synthase [Erysipelotrichaceae bacterium]|nr:RluA family pseudouridine synthase [Erysipelotrichaceae bacterium]MDY5251658.1 RluA family pseudouridine synthase [Erysipelotrichaceae bacterium]
MVRIKIQKDSLAIKGIHDMTLNAFLASYHLGKALRYQLINERISVNKEKVHHDHLLQRHDELRVDLAYEVDFEPSGQLPEVVYEDDLVLIVKKRAGQIVHDDQNMDALANDVASYYLANDLHRHVRYIHRLDKQTQGLVFFSKLDFFGGYYNEQLLNKQIKREYLAIVKGKFKDQIVEKPLAKDRHVNNKYRVSAQGKYAKTKFTCLQYHNGYSLLHCELFTGRTHQIRVHLSSIGFAIVNDEIYGQPDPNFKYMGLYAYKLSFKDLINDRTISVSDDRYEDLDHFKML